MRDSTDPKKNTRAGFFDRTDGIASESFKRALREGSHAWMQKKRIPKKNTRTGFFDRTDGTHLHVAPKARACTRAQRERASMSDQP